MSQDDRQQEDVAGLFRKFGGDATRYKEFAPVESPRAAGNWPLVNGARSAPEAEARPPAAAQPAPVVTPAPTVAVAAPAPAPAPVAETTGTASAPRELDALFARLLGAAQPAAAAGQGLMSHWRRPG